MSFTAFCATCQRTVYLHDNDTPVCPVCASVLLETVDPNGETGSNTTGD